MGDFIMKPIVSFIIPAFNEEKDIGRCLQSIGQLSYPKNKVEIFVMDNGSTDGTHAILTKMGVSFAIIEKVPVSVLRNRGAKNTSGEFLAFIDADIELSSNWIEQALATMGDSNNVAVGCFPRAPVDSTWVGRVKDLHQRLRHSREVVLQVPWLPSANFLVRKKDFEAVGGFNEGIETGEDVDLGYRLESQGALVRNLNLDAIHWGEDQDLMTLWKKEVWRGMGNVNGIFSHGFRMDELPSLLYPLYVLSFTMAFPFGIIVDVLQSNFFWSPLILMVLVLPSLILALKTASSVRQPITIAPLFALYFVYGLARAFSFIKALFPTSCQVSS